MSHVLYWICKYTNKKEEEMSQMFKALATVTAWALFILGWLFGLGNLVIAINTGVMFTVGKEGWVETLSYFVLAIVCLILSVVAMRLRQKME